MSALSDRLHGFPSHRRPPKYVFVRSIRKGGLDTDTEPPAAGSDNEGSEKDPEEVDETEETGKPCRGFDGGASLD